MNLREGGALPWRVDYPWLLLLPKHIPWPVYRVLTRSGYALPHRAINSHGSIFQTEVLCIESTCFCRCECCSWIPNESVVTLRYCCCKTERMLVCVFWSKLVCSITSIWKWLMLRVKNGVRKCILWRALNYCGRSPCSWKWMLQACHVTL